MEAFRGFEHVPDSMRICDRCGHTFYAHALIDDGERLRPDPARADDVEDVCPSCRFGIAARPPAPRGGES